MGENINTVKSRLYFKVVTFREYKYSDDRQTADAEVPEITVDGNAGGTVAETAKDTTKDIYEEI